MTLIIRYQLHRFVVMMISLYSSADITDLYQTMLTYVHICANRLSLNAMHLQLVKSTINDIATPMSHIINLPFFDRHNFQCHENSQNHS